MAKGKALGPRTLDAIGGLIKRDRARVKNDGTEGAGDGPQYFAPAIVRVTSTIDARSGTTPGSGDAELWKISSDELEQNAAESTITIYNLGTSTIAGTTTDPVYCLATQVRGGAFVATPLWAPCEVLKTLTGYTTAPTNPLVLMVTTASPNCAQWVAGSTCT